MAGSAFGANAVRRNPDAPVIEVGDATIEAEHYLIATGADPVIPPAFEGVAYMTSTTAMEVTRVRVAAGDGGGYVALEQAQLFARLRVNGDGAGPLHAGIEGRAGSRHGGALEVFADDIRVVRRATVSEVEQAGDQVTVTATITGGTQQFRAAKVLVATGRRPNTDGLNLEAVQVKTGENNEVVVSDGLQSSNPRIWAAGDVTGHREFVYVAAHHGDGRRQRLHRRQPGSTTAICPA